MKSWYIFALQGVAVVMASVLLAFTRHIARRIVNDPGWKEPAFTPLEAPRTAEDARRILEGSVDSDFTRVQLCSRLILFAAGIILDVAAALFLYFYLPQKDHYLIIPSFCVIAIPAVLPLFRWSEYRETLKMIRNGRYFSQNTEEEVVETARKYVEEYNRFECSVRGIKSAE